MQWLATAPSEPGHVRNQHAADPVDRLAELERANDDLRRENRRLARVAFGAWGSASVEDQQQALDAITASVSWRATAPLRRVAEAIRGLRSSRG